MHHARYFGHAGRSLVGDAVAVEVGAGRDVVRQGGLSAEVTA